MAFNLFETPKLTKPVQVYDPSKSVQENMNGQGQPSAQNIISAYQTPQAQLQLQQGQQQTAPVKTTPVVDPNSATSGMDAVIANMYTSPEQEEKMRKASVANQRILAIGDALRHIGNIYNTVNGAPAMQFNNPVQEEYNRYLQGKALRDKANQTYLSYQQAKAAQDAKQKRWEAERVRKDKMDEWTIKKTEQQIKSNEAKDKRLEDLAAAKIAYQQGVIDDKEFNRRVKEYYMSLGYTPTGGRLGGSGGRSGGGGSKPTQWQTRYNDYDYANQNGIPVMEETTDILGNKTTKRRDPNVVHAEVEEHKRRNSGRGSGSGQGRFGSFSIHKK